MKFLRLFPRKQKRNPGRELALMGVEKRKKTIAAVAAQMRDELGLDPHPALRRAE